MSTNLPTELDSLWRAYVDAERVGVRAHFLEALNAFVGKATGHDLGDWSMQLVAESGTEAYSGPPIRMPLFRRVVGPALVDAVLRERPGAALLLSRLDGHLWNARDVHQMLPAKLQDKGSLLREALRVTPTAKDVHLAYLEWAAGALSYSIHEVPSGVLSGPNGASARECAELLDFLDEAERAAEAADMFEEYAELFASCRLHFTEYGRYRSGEQRAASYEKHLLDRGLWPESVPASDPPRSA